MSRRFIFSPLQLSCILVSFFLLLLLFTYLTAESTPGTPGFSQRFEQDEHRPIVNEDISIKDSSTATWVKYDKSLNGFTFRYPADYKAFENNEVTAKQADGNLYYQEDFAAVFGYRPPQVIAEVYVSYDTVQPGVHHNPIFRLWVFENPAQLSTDDWYQKYQYYPAFWGQMSDTEISANIPSSRVEIDGYVASFSAATDYRRERYGYLIHGNRLFLFQVDMPEKVSQEILSTFQIAD